MRKGRTRRVTSVFGKHPRIGTSENRKASLSKTFSAHVFLLARKPSANTCGSWSESYSEPEFMLHRTLQRSYRSLPTRMHMHITLVGKSRSTTTSLKSSITSSRATGNRYSARLQVSSTSNVLDKLFTRPSPKTIIIGHTVV